MNTIYLSGEIAEKPKFFYETHGEKFYDFYISSKRKSENVDTLRCVCPEVFLDKLNEKDNISIVGEIRTKNYKDGEHTKLDIYVFIKELHEYGGTDENYVELDGYICNEPVYRETPTGRQITDYIIASHRTCKGKSDYIPAISWGRCAYSTSMLEIGTHIYLSGRLQSRKYKKKIGENEFEEKTAYELSTNYYKKLEEREVLVDEDNVDCNSELQRLQTV